MRSKLQYIYSISVFAGVLVTSYMMMSKEDSSRLPLQAMEGSSLRVEAGADPALQSLIDVENALRFLKKEKVSTEKRSPSFKKSAE